MFGKNNYEILSSDHFDYENFTLHLLKKSLMENFIFCVVMINKANQWIFLSHLDIRKRFISNFCKLWKFTHVVHLPMKLASWFTQDIAFKLSRITSNIKSNVSQRSEETPQKIKVFLYFHWRLGMHSCVEVDTKIKLGSNLETKTKHPWSIKHFTFLFADFTQNLTPYPENIKPVCDIPPSIRWNKKTSNFTPMFIFKSN